MLSNGSCREGENENACEFAGCGDGDTDCGRSYRGTASGTSGECAAGPVAGGESGEWVCESGGGAIREEHGGSGRGDAAEKYVFKPSPEMNSFGHLVMHIAQSNNTFCAKISGQTTPDVKIAETDPKDKLVAAVKDSFAFCTAALAKVDDSKLGEQFVLFGNRPISRGGALVALGGSWTDHYATQAIYLRLNGILPPTAQPAK